MWPRLRSKVQVQCKDFAPDCDTRADVRGQDPGTKPGDATRRWNQKTEPGDRTRGQDQGTESGDRIRGQKQRWAVLSASWVRGPGLGQNSQGLPSVVLPRSSASCSITSVTSTCRAAHRPVRRTFLDVPAPEAAAGEKLIPASVGSEVRGQGSYVIKKELQ